MALRILIVEDDKHIRKILEQLLKHEPSLVARAPEVVLAQDGKEGLSALDSGPFDLVISDLLMPRMDGFGFTRELRKHKYGADVPLIVTSAIYKDQATIARLHAETGAQFFAKPFQIKDILNAVKRLVGDEIAATKPARPDVTPTGARKSAAMPTVGSLAERRPPRILLELWEKKTTGTLLLQRGKVKKEIAFVHGTPVAATSNLRTETLGHFLVARGVIDEARHQQALKRAQESQERLGQALVELGFIGDKDLMKQLGAQMRAKITNVLRWKDGDWMLTPGPPPATPLQTPVEAPRVVFNGLHKTAHVDEIAQELAGVRGRIALTLRAERHREAFVRVFGDKGLTALQRRPLIEELLVGSDPTPMLVQLDALFACGMAELESAAVDKKAPGEKTDPIALERLPVASVIVDPLPPAEQNLYDKLFGDETGPVTLPELDDASSPFDDDEISGVMQVPSASAPSASAAAAARAPSPPDAAVEELRREVLHEYLAVQGKSHYEVLRLGRGAPAEEIASAYGALGKQFRLERFADVDLGPDYARLEEIHSILRAAFETLSSRELRHAYDAELERAQRPSKAALDADLLAQNAIEKLAAGDADTASDLLERAVAAAPDQADYHALLAWAVFHNEGGDAAAGATAWRHLHAAFEIDADHVSAHEYAGRIAAAAGDDARAIDHLTRVLDADPARADALTALEAACLRRGEHKRLERQYRKLIHRLGDAHDPERALRLWWRLAELYRARLGDRASAKVAYEIAAKLAPDDPRPREALARLYAENPDTWRQAAQALRESWRLSPDDPAPGRALFELHRAGERWDAAYAVAAALAVRGAADGEAGELLRRFRPRFLVRAQPALDDDVASLAERVRHADDDRDLSQLFARVFAVWQPPVGWELLGVVADDRIDGALLPTPFLRVLGYCAAQLGVAAPPVYRRADFAEETHVGAARPPVLLAGPQALALADQTALAFRLGRALTYLLPGRAVAGSLPSRQLKQAVLAAMTLAQSSLRIDDPDGEIKAIRVALTAAAPALGRQVAPICDRIVAGAQATLNLGRYTRGLARTADRVGLLLCNDLATAVRIVLASAAPGAENELIDFALSDEYLQARDALGLSICV